MNTIRSVGYGWGVLIVAGAGSYYFAKRSVNADRAERAAAEEKRRQQRERMRLQEEISRTAAMNSNGKPARKATSTSDNPPPSRQIEEGDASPIRHAPPPQSKSNYESSDPFRSRKGDRFS